MGLISFDELPEYTPHEGELITAWVEYRKLLRKHNGEPDNGVVHLVSEVQRAINNLKADVWDKAFQDGALYATALRAEIDHENLPVELRRPKTTKPPNPYRENYE